MLKRCLTYRLQQQLGCLGTALNCKPAQQDVILRQVLCEKSSKDRQGRTLATICSYNTITMDCMNMFFRQSNMPAGQATYNDSYGPAMTEYLHRCFDQVQ